VADKSLRDRPAFNAVMAAAPPIDYESLGMLGERMVQAHRFFSEQARQWLLSSGGDPAVRGNAIETVVRDLLQMVVIDLTADENAQEIFETLNARGAQLTAADLIKNFIFQRILERDGNLEDAYERHWKEFESGFWESEVNVGRLRHQRLQRSRELTQGCSPRLDHPLSETHQPPTRTREGQTVRPL
jgi:hypothetical protein